MAVDLSRMRHAIVMANTAMNNLPPEVRGLLGFNMPDLSSLLAESVSPSQTNTGDTRVVDPSLVTTSAAEAGGETILLADSVRSIGGDDTSSKRPYHGAKTRHSRRAYKRRQTRQARQPQELLGKFTYQSIENWIIEGMGDTENKTIAGSIQIQNPATNRPVWIQAYGKVKKQTITNRVQAIKALLRSYLALNYPTVLTKTSKEPKTRSELSANKISNLVDQVYDNLRMRRTATLRIQDDKTARRYLSSQTTVTRSSRAASTLMGASMLLKRRDLMVTLLHGREVKSRIALGLNNTSSS